MDEVTSNRISANELAVFEEAMQEAEKLGLKREHMEIAVNATTGRMLLREKQNCFIASPRGLRSIFPHLKERT